MKISDPLIELLAIKLYEHDYFRGEKHPPSHLECWAKLNEEDREIYRQMARGKRKLYE